ncbi:hypothetical protein [Pleomorphomonas koreensis]|uniref:hypothetical protein n=1 Tax=Pleomorphomonas koreensis TaxID=257440 RepID=UPI00047DDDB4|nr:hypothetical protein [Pleomorphomonas koreensis]
MSPLSPLQQSAVLGLCRERVPLGVQARGLKLNRHDVKAAALELLKNGDIGELPADDIRGGRAFSWPEVMLPDAPEFVEEPIADAELSRDTLPARYWNGRRLSDRHFIVARSLAEVPVCTCVPVVEICDRLEALGYRGERKSVQVAVLELRRLGFVITFDIDGDGYVLSAESRAAWMGGDHA